MQLLIFPALLLLVSTTNGQNTTITTGTFNPLANSVIIDLPPYPIFTVPQCRPKRSVIIASDPTNGNAGAVNVGYQITGLQNGTSYTVQYIIEGKAFSPVTFQTVTVFASPPDVFRRSGGMVVITVILSIAMFLLVIGLVVVLVLGGRGSK